MLNKNRVNFCWLFNPISRPPAKPKKQEKVKELEREIDRTVYELYKLTPEEMGIVEEKSESIF